MDTNQTLDVYKIVGVKTKKRATLKRKVEIRKGYCFTSEISDILQKSMPCRGPVVVL